MSKKKPIQSLNTWTAVISFLIAAIFTSQGIEVSLSGEQIAEALLTKEGLALVLFFGMNLMTPILKTYRRIKDNGFDWHKLVSRNLVSHALAAISVLLGLLLDQETAGFVIAMITQAVTFIWHRFIEHTPEEITGIHKE